MFEYLKYNAHTEISKQKAYIILFTASNFLKGLSIIYTVRSNYQRENESYQHSLYLRIAIFRLMGALLKHTQEICTNRAMPVIKYPLVESKACVIMLKMTSKRRGRKLLYKFCSNLVDTLKLNYSCKYFLKRSILLNSEGGSKNMQKAHDHCSKEAWHSH